MVLTSQREFMGMPVPVKGPGAKHNILSGISGSQSRGTSLNKTQSFKPRPPIKARRISSPIGSLSIVFEVKSILKRQLNHPYIRNTSSIMIKLFYDYILGF